MPMPINRIIEIISMFVCFEFNNIMYSFAYNSILDRNRWMWDRQKSFYHLTSFYLNYKLLLFYMCFNLYARKCIMEDSVSRFWDKYIAKTVDNNVPEGARRWYVRHIEIFI